MNTKPKPNREELNKTINRLANKRFENSVCNLCNKTHWHKGLLDVKEACECIENHFKKRMK